MNTDHDKPTAGDERLPLPASELRGKPVPRRVLIAPWGRVDSTNGTFTVDDESAREVADAFERHGTDIPVDYEHQTLGGRYSSPNGQAPAAGWIKRVEARPRVGLFAHVAWTDAALALLADGAYRYLSPVALIRKRDRKMVALHSAALTNKPAIVGMKPIVNRDENPEPTPDAPALVALRQHLDLAPTADSGVVLTAARERIAELETARARDDAGRRVEQALRAGKLVEAQREWAANLALKDPDLFDDWCATAPVILRPGRTEPPDLDDTGDRQPRAERAARAEFRAHPELAALTTEEAYVADATRSLAPHRP